MPIQIQLRRKSGPSTKDTIYSVADWNYLVNKPSTYPPTTHGHNASDVNDGTLSADRIPTLNYNKVDFANQNLNTTNNVQFNQVSTRRFLQLQDGVPTNNLGLPTVSEMALFEKQFDNKSAFYDISKIKFETFDGTNWTDISLSITDTQKKRLVGGDLTSSVSIPNGVIKYKITLAAVSYVFLSSLYVYWSGNGNNTQVHIWKKHNSGNWQQHTSSTTLVTSWPGHLYLPFPSIPWHPNATLGSHFHDVAIEFIPDWVNGNAINLYNLELWGGYPAGKRRVFSVNEDMVVSFPRNIAANGQFVILDNDSRLSNARPASDVFAWAKAANKPTYNLDEVIDGTIRKLLTLGETSLTAYRGDRGKLAYDHSQAAHAPSGAQANVLEAVQVAGSDLAIISKKVNIPFASASTPGVVKISVSGTTVNIITT